MSCDFGIWFPHRRLTDGEAVEVYGRLCEGDTTGVEAHPSVGAFYRELTARHPEIDTIAEEQIDDHDLCPWSCALDRSDAHLVISCVWSKAEMVDRTLRALAHKHGLAVYDPQSGRITYPNETTGGD